MTRPPLPDPYPVQPLAGPLQAKRVRVPGSKSITNRALILAGLAQGESALRGALFSDDTRYMSACLGQLGIPVRQDPASGIMRVQGCGGRIPQAPAEPLFVGNAGTAARFLPPMVAAAGRGSFRFSGDARMQQRPMGDLLKALEALGSPCLADDGSPAQAYPFTLQARGLAGGAAQVDISASSQFASGLLMAGPCMPKRLDLWASGSRSELPYVAMTVEMMKQFGAQVATHGQGGSFSALPGAYQGRDYAIEPDLSAAGYFFAAAALCGGKVTVLGSSKASLQQDVRLLALLQHMGCLFYEYEEGLTLEREPGAALKGVEVDMNAFSDQALTVAALAPFCSAPVAIRNVAHIRHQECDRIQAICQNLRALGAEAEELEDGVRIKPCANLHGARLKTWGDHRVAMAFSLVGLKVPGVSIEGPACTAKTFEGFWQALEELHA
jgi:3-phosphoshikimate 1-carboxyvinyltransferase